MCLSPLLLSLKDLDNYLVDLYFVKYYYIISRLLCFYVYACIDLQWWAPLWTTTKIQPFVKVVNFIHTSPALFSPTAPAVPSTTWLRAELVKRYLNNFAPNLLIRTSEIAYENFCSILGIENCVISSERDLRRRIRRHRSDQRQKVLLEK